MTLYPLFPSLVTLLAHSSEKNTDSHSLTIQISTLRLHTQCAFFLNFCSPSTVVLGGEVSELLLHLRCSKDCTYYDCYFSQPTRKIQPLSLVTTQSPRSTSPQAHCCSYCSHHPWRCTHFMRLVWRHTVC